MLRNRPFLSAAALFVMAGAGPALAQAQRPKPAPTVPAAPPPQVQRPAAPHVPDLSRAAFIAQMDLEHRKRDADGDGKVTRAELER